MATIIKTPCESSKGIVVFTDKERDSVLVKRKDQLKKLKKRWVTGLHHNYFQDYNFKYNPLFDFSIATKDDLKEINGVKFPMFQASVVNFNKDNFWKFNNGEKHWDVLNISRNIDYKKNETFLEVARELFNRGVKIRMLMIVYEKKRFSFNKKSLNDLYLENFSKEERQLFNLIELDTSSPPFDLKTLSFFYYNSRVFCSTSNKEHRPRIPSYAISSGMPIVVADSISTLFPEILRNEPGVFVANTINEFSNQIINSINFIKSSTYSKKVMQPFIDCFSNKNSVQLFSEFIKLNFNINIRDSKNVNLKNLDKRLARHLGFEYNMISSVPINMKSFMNYLINANDSELLKVIRLDDLEMDLSKLKIISSKKLYRSKTTITHIKELLIKFKLDKYPRLILKYIK